MAKKPTPKTSAKVIAAAEEQTSALSAAAETAPRGTPEPEPEPKSKKSMEDRVDAIERVLRLIGYGELLDE